MLEIFSKVQVVVALALLAWVGYGVPVISPKQSGVDLRLLPNSFSSSVSSATVADAATTIWNGEDLPGLGIHSQTVLQLDSHLYRVYRDNRGNKITVYVGYWRAQGGDYQAAKHSPAVCLPSNGWRVEDQQILEFSSGDKVNSIAGSSGLAHYRFYYWFFSGEREYTREWQALGQLALSALSDGRLDGGIVELSATAETPTSVIDEFVAEFRPALRKLVTGSLP